MLTSQEPSQRISRLAIPFCLAVLVGGMPLSSAQQEPSAKPGPAGTPESSSKKLAPRPSTLPAPEESQALEKAFESVAGNPQKLIKNLQEFLERFPQSPHRERVLRTMFNQALQANDPHQAAAAAEKLLELKPDDPDLLSTLVDLLGRESDAASREKALRYATRLVEWAEKLEGKPSDASGGKRQETQVLIRATAYLMRGKVYAKAGENDKAVADYEKSFAAYPTAQVAESLGDLAAKRGDTDRAIAEYATAFAFPEKAVDPAPREQLRKKLGSAYVARYQSEKGLGDLILARYDDLVRTLHARWKTQGTPNADARDPFDYVLERPDGSPFRLADYRGKLVVMDFWATWCGPCRLEGKLFERVRNTFRNDPAAIFLAVNVDEDREGVPAFVKEEKWTVPVVYAQGLDRLLGVRALPTLVIFGRDGRVVYRQQGLDPESFAETLEKKIRESLDLPAPSSATSR